MTKRRYEIETTMNAIVDYVASIQSAFVAQEPFELIVNVLENGIKTVRIIDGIAEAGRIDHGQPQLDATLFDFNGGRVQFNGLFLLFDGARYDAFRIQIGQKQAVDQCGFAQTRFAHHHQCKFESFFDRFSMHLIGQIGETNVPRSFEARKLNRKKNIF